MDMLPEADQIGRKWEILIKNVTQIALLRVEMLTDGVT